jgi:hypothetical protein
MNIDTQVESTVRESLAAAVTRNNERLLSAIGSFADGESLTQGLRLAGAVGLYVLYDQYGNPSESDITEIAREVAAAEQWASVQADEVVSYLGAFSSPTAFSEFFSLPRFVVLAYVITGSLISFFHGPDEEWWDYLDRAEDVIEMAQDPDGLG